MVGLSKVFSVRRNLALACMASVTLAACDDTGFLNRSGAATDAAQPPAINAPGQRVSQERDVERPDIFEATDRALWDGRPSLGGVWVAHPDVQEPERVLIRNTANGETIVGALFRRERLNPGPEIQISSDAADALGALAGAPVELYVVALRREEVEVTVPDDGNPVIAGLEAPVNVEAAPLDPSPATETAEPVTDTSAETAPAVAAATAMALAVETADAGAETATVAAELAPAEIVDISGVFDTPLPPADGPRAQIGVYSSEGNATADAARIQEAGIAAEVLTETMGGQTVWRLVAGPLVSDAALAALQDIGFVDAFIIEATE